jgi:hypothetical protein
MCGRYSWLADIAQGLCLSRWLVPGIVFVEQIGHGIDGHLSA